MLLSACIIHGQLRQRGPMLSACAALESSCFEYRIKCWEFRATKFHLMKEIERLRRERYSKMLNLLPELIAEKQAPSFFYQCQQRYIDWDKINLNHIQVKVPQRDDPATRMRKRIQLQKNKIATMSMLGKQKQLKVDHQDLHLETIVGREEGNPIQFQPYSLQRAALYDKGCITCGKSNILVKYHQDRHICLECRQKVTTLKGDPVVIFQDDDGEVVVLGLSDNHQQGKQVYQVPSDELEIFGYRCYVSFSAPDDLIVLLHDRLNEHKAAPASKYKRMSVFHHPMHGSTWDVKEKVDGNFIRRNKKAIELFCQNRGSTTSQRMIKRPLTVAEPKLTRPQSVMQFSKRVTMVCVKES